MNGFCKIQLNFSVSEAEKAGVTELAMMRVSATNPILSLIYSSFLKNFVYCQLVLQEYKTASTNRSDVKANYGAFLSKWGYPWGYPQGWGLSSLAPQDYNIERSTTQRPLICRSSDYRAIERCLLVIDCLTLGGAPMAL